MKNQKTLGTDPLKRQNTGKIHDGGETLEEEKAMNSSGGTIVEFVGENYVYSFLESKFGD